MRDSLARVVRAGAARVRRQPRRRVPISRLTTVPEDEGEPLGFKFEVGVRPGAELGDYKGLEVGRAEPDVPEDVIDREVERMREAFARLEPVERAAEQGDVLLVDFQGTIDGEPFEGGEAHDYLLELGQGRLIEGFEEQLRGAEAGDERRSRSPSPRTTGPSTWRPRRRLRGDGQGGAREAAAGSR